MCERSPLFLLEAKSIISDLLTRTLELFDLSFHLVEHYRLTKFLSEREQQRDYQHFSLHNPCKLNYNIISDLDTYLNRLHTSCRLIKSNLRSLHAARITSSNDYIVIDDEIYELERFFKLKLNKLWYEFQSIKDKPSNEITNKRYYSQRKIHSSQTIQSFVFHPESKNNSHQTISKSEEYLEILRLFRKISQFYQFLIKQLYGVHTVRDSHILQPIAISIIRLLLFITNKLKQNLSPTQINRNHFGLQQHEEVCHVPKKILSTKPKFKLIEIHPVNIDTLNAAEEKDDKSIDYVRNDNHLSNIKEDEESVLDFDEDEFYRLANLQRDD
jgi:hypothetical protein